MEKRGNPEDRRYDADGRAPAQENSLVSLKTRSAVSDLNPGDGPDSPADGRREIEDEEPAQTEELDPLTIAGDMDGNPGPEPENYEPPAEHPQNGSSRQDADLKWLDDPQTLYLRKKLHVPDAISFAGSLAQALSSSCVSDAMKKVKMMSDIITSTDQAPYPVFAIDPDGKVIAWNREMERITDIPAHDMIGRGDHAYAVPFYGKPRPMLVDYLILPVPASDKSAPGDRDVLTSKSETIRVQGRLQIMWSRGTRIFDEDGNVIAAVQSIGIQDPAPAARQFDRERPAPEPPARSIPPPPRESPYPVRPPVSPPRAKSTERPPGPLSAIRRTEDLRKTLGQLLIKEDGPTRNTGTRSSDRRPAPGSVPGTAAQPAVTMDTLLRNIEALTREDTAGGRGTITPGLVIRRETPPPAMAVSGDLRQAGQRTPFGADDLFEQIIVHAREGIIAYDTGLNCILWNTFMEQLTGIPVGEVLGRHAFDMLPALKEAGSGLLLEQALSGRTVESSDISCHIPGSGKQVWVRLIVSPLRDSRRGVIGVISVVQDTTARKVMEFALQTTIMQLMESEEKYRSVFNAKNDPLLLIDTATRRIMDLNTAISDLYGYPREEFLQLSPGDLFTEPEKINDILSQKSSGICLTRQRKRDGSVFPADVSYAYFELKGKLVLILSVRDLSQAYQTADALRLANTKLNLLIGVTRHDVLNNLTVLMGYNDLMKHTVRDGKILEMLDKEEIALKAVQRQIDFTREYYNLGVKSPIWQNICEISTRAYSQFITTVAFTCDTRDLEICADPLLEKVFYNLFDNAIRHGERVTHIRVYSVREGSELVLIFGDDGKGIRPENKERIFKRGFGKHTGLGLFLTREILAITRIDISETGEFEKGARFELRIPAGMYRFSGADNPLKAAGSESTNLHAW
jgi:PAS domain S-box-containing protein